MTIGEIAQLFDTQTAMGARLTVVEGANVSVGRGTDTPFQVLGAPWIHGSKLADYLARRQIPGVRFTPVSFIPSQDRFQDKRCQGVRIVLVDRDSLRSGLLGVELISALHRLYPRRFRIDSTLLLVGSHDVLSAIEKGENPRVIAARWQSQLAAFKRLRERYLLYPRHLRAGSLVARSTT